MIYQSANQITRKKIVIFFLVISWFFPTGIGFDIMGTSFDTAKIIYTGIIVLILILILLRVELKLEFIRLDKIFMLFIIVQLFAIIFYIDYKMQSIYLMYTIIYQYSAYYFARFIFKDIKLFFYFIKLIIIMIVFSTVYMYLNVEKIYIFDQYRTYSMDTISHSHEWIRVLHNINIGRSYTGHMINPSYYAQYINLLILLIVPYILYKFKERNIVINYLLIIILFASSLMTQSRVSILFITVLLVVMNILRYKNIMKLNYLVLGIVVLIYFVNSDIIKYYYYLLSSLFVYIPNELLSSSISSEISEEVANMSRTRPFLYSEFFSYYSMNIYKMIFGYGVLPEQIYKMPGNSDLSWVFSILLQVGILGLLIYIYFYYEFFNKLYSIFKSTKNTIYIKIIVIYFIGVLIISLPGANYTINTMYYFILGSIVSFMKGKLKYLPEK